MKKLFVTLIVVGLFLLAGCSALDTPPEPGPVTNAEDIMGTWEIIGEGYIQYNEDGTFRYASSRESLADRPLAVGEFWFEGGQYFEKETEVHGVPPCGSTPGIYEVQLLENGSLLFDEVEDECPARARTTSREHKPVD